MPRYKLSAEERAAEQARRSQLLTLMSQFNIQGVSDFRGLFNEMVGAFLENGLEGELDDELGYGKYDYRDKDTDNSRNGHTRKSLKTSTTGSSKSRFRETGTASMTPSW